MSSSVDQVCPVSCLCTALGRMQQYPKHEVTDISNTSSIDCIFVFLLCQVCFSASILPISGIPPSVFFFSLRYITRFHNDGEHHRDCHGIQEGKLSIFLPNITVSSSASDIIKECRTIPSTSPASAPISVRKTILSVYIGTDLLVIKAQYLKWSQSHAVSPIY